MLTVRYPRCESRVDPLGIDDRAPRLSWALESEARGRISSFWQIEGELFSLEVLVPPNTAATVHVPSTEGVSEGGRSVEEADGVELLRTGEGETVVAVGSGRYEFSGKLAQG